MKDLAPKNGKAEGKPRASLIPMDVLIKYLVPAYEEGLIKYDRESWRKGFLISDVIDSAIRHIDDFWYRGNDLDEGALKLGIEKHPLAGAIFSLISALHTLEHRPELDDRFCQATGVQKPTCAQTEKPEYSEKAKTLSLPPASGKSQE